MLKEYGVGWVSFSTIMAWNTESFGQDLPQTWAEFFCTEKFQGRRALYARPKPTLDPRMEIGPQDVLLNKKCRRRFLNPI